MVKYVGKVYEYERILYYGPRRNSRDVRVFTNGLTDPRHLGLAVGESSELEVIRGNKEVKEELLLTKEMYEIAKGESSITIDGTVYQASEENTEFVEGQKVVNIALIEVIPIDNTTNVKISMAEIDEINKSIRKDISNQMERLERGLVRRYELRTDMDATEEAFQKQMKERFNGSSVFEGMKKMFKTVFSLESLLVCCLIVLIVLMGLTILNFITL